MSKWRAVDRSIRPDVMAAISVELGQRTGILGNLSADDMREALFSLIGARRLKVEVRGAMLDPSLVYVRFKMDRSLGWDRFDVKM